MWCCAGCVSARPIGNTCFACHTQAPPLSPSVPQVGYTCYQQIKKPDHRLDELEKMTREKVSKAREGASGSGFRDASEAGPQLGTAR